MAKCFQAAFLTCVFLMTTGQASFSEQSNATRTLKVQGTSIVVPKACKVMRRESNAAECILEGEGGGYWSFGVFTSTVPSFSAIMADIDPEMADPSEDIELVLQGMVEASSEGIGGPGARLDKFSHRRATTLPRGAKGCELVRKDERFRNARQQQASVRKLELLCAKQSGRDSILESGTVVSFTFVPKLGEKAPADFEAKAMGWLGSVKLSR